MIVSREALGTETCSRRKAPQLFSIQFLHIVVSYGQIYIMILFKTGVGQIHDAALPKYCKASNKGFLSWTTSFPSKLWICIHLQIIMFFYKIM